MNLVKESEELAVWLQDNVNGIRIPSHKRGRVSAGCFDTVLEHQQAVVILIRYNASMKL